MENILIQGFDAAQALSYSAFTGRVQPSDDRHRLDIEEKERTSSLPWRGQFSPQLIEYLLAKYCKKGDRILDPFCGSGTVLREAARGGFNALGIDVNPAAVCLAKVSELAGVEPERRWSLVDRIREFCRNLLLFSDDQGVVEAEKAANLFFSLQLDEQEKIALEGALLFLFSNSKSIAVSKVTKGVERYLSVAFDSHSSQSQLKAKIGDARSVDEANNTFDYLVTSPPYINVFNYHQNYRPIIEALGHTPLTAAKSEIGANRKFRQNRYMTVVQYCMDIAQFFVEASRVLKDQAKITIVLGRESNIRSVSFKNSELINAIACEGMGYKLIEWNERKFMNRFGESIYEDVLTMIPQVYTLDKAVEIGRAVGRQALRNALEYCPVERGEEISEAIASANKIIPSLLIRNCS
jgi:methylase of polypeptide subunit release factors|tara:strand:+ start:4666 stop:5892 length:1227 start_codon:yes stop_codon:yes gene_type:complete